MLELLKLAGPGRLGFALGAVVGGVIGLAAVHFVRAEDARDLAAQTRETISATVRADTCAASVLQMGKDSEAAKRESVQAQQVEQKQAAATEVRTVAVTRYIKEAPKCSDALQRAWQSAPQ